jgi:acyl-ACP thioesterase
MVSGAGTVGMVAIPAAGRRFTASRPVRLGDTTAAGRLRLDAAARYLQDVADDDATAALGTGEGGWLVRRTRLAVWTPAVLRERLDLVTFCSGTGGRWAERRTVVRGERGGALDAESLWVYVDAATGRPRRLPDGFDSAYGTAAAGRTVSARLAHGDPPPLAEVLPFPLRATDADVMGHVNNAVAFAALEEALRRVFTDLRWPLLVEAEYRSPLPAVGTVELLTSEVPDGADLWLRLPPDAPSGGHGATNAGTRIETAVSMRVRRLS